MRNETDMKPIGVAELIDRVKQELLSTPKSKDPLFIIKEVEIEVSFTVERSAQGGIDFQVIQGGVDKTWSNVQKIRITLDPLLQPDQLRKQITESSKKQVTQSLVRSSDVE